jgi:hypothetical protein
MSMLWTRRAGDRGMFSQARGSSGKTLYFGVPMPWKKQRK